MSCGRSPTTLLPDVEQEFRFITPGSVLGTLLWLLGTWGFAQYAGHFGSYNVTFGSIGGVVVLMTWFYITGFIFVMGGEINAILENASGEGKASGARGPRRGAAAARAAPERDAAGRRRQGEHRRRDARGGGSPADLPADG